MRASAIALCAALAGCAVNLGQNDDSAPSPAPAPALSGCLPLTDVATAITGRVSQIAAPDQSSLVITASATFTGAAGTCLDGGVASLTPPVPNATPMAAIAAKNSAYLFFSSSDGYGVARDGGASSLLWTSDRPSYGSAAALVDDEIYVFGGLAARFLSADVYLARAPLSQIDVPSAYEYWLGGGAFGPDPDQAAPVFEGGTSPTIAFDSEHNRWLTLYATPLASEVTARTGLDITGPWSAPHILGKCDLPARDPSSFCGDLSLTPALAGSGEITFTQAVATFSRPANTTDLDYWTRLIRTAWPAELP